MSLAAFGWRLLLTASDVQPGTKAGYSDRVIGRFGCGTDNQLACCNESAVENLELVIRLIRLIGCELSPSEMLWAFAYWEPAPVTISSLFDAPCRPTIVCVVLSMCPPFEMTSDEFDPPLLPTRIAAVPPVPPVAFQLIPAPPDLDPIVVGTVGVANQDDAGFQIAAGDDHLIRFISGRTDDGKPRHAKQVARIRWIDVERDGSCCVPQKIQRIDRTGKRRCRR